MQLWRHVTVAQSSSTCWKRSSLRNFSRIQRMAVLLQPSSQNHQKRGFQKSVVRSDTIVAVFVERPNSHACAVERTESAVCPAFLRSPSLPTRVFVTGRDWKRSAAYFPYTWACVCIHTFAKAVAECLRRKLAGELRRHRSVVVPTSQYCLASEKLPALNLANRSVGIQLELVGSRQHSITRRGRRRRRSDRAPCALRPVVTDVGRRSAGRGRRRSGPAARPPGRRRPSRSGDDDRPRQRRRDVGGRAGQIVNLIEYSIRIR